MTFLKSSNPRVRADIGEGDRAKVPIKCGLRYGRFRHRPVDLCALVANNSPARYAPFSQALGTNQVQRMVIGRDLLGWASRQRVEQQCDVGVAEPTCAGHSHRAGRPDREGRDAINQNARTDHHVQLVDQACGEQAVPGGHAA